MEAGICRATLCMTEEFEKNILANILANISVNILANIPPEAKTAGGACKLFLKTSLKSKLKKS